MTDAKKRLHSLKQKIGESLCKDQWSFHRTFRSLESVLKTNGDLKGLEQLESKVKISSERARARAARIPAVSFPDDLPVSALADQVEGLIAANQVVIISGETGSGKTTQIPKILMKLGRGSRGQIVHTQPRRIAARSVANRLAQETGTELGDIIGYQVRFNDRSSSENLIKVVTDGILIAETQTDRFLSAYDSIIIDEAHERNLNIDFLFGYLKNVLPKRPELKIVITSATIDAEKFSKHFNDAPVIKVSGRLYPVDILYEDSLTKEGEQLPVEEYGLVTMALRRISEYKGSGDVLVFLPGEREIRQVDAVIRKDFLRGSVEKSWEILMLFSRLSVREQNKVFGPSHKRRIILSTNVAETSLTIPRIQFVIDSGEARLKRYSYRNKVEMLQVERISKAAADQRAGRAGRLMHGVCFRLYSLEDFQKRSEFTDPEILRSSLASVILRMQYLRLGDPQEFPFVDLPLPRAIVDGYQLLEELGAISGDKKLTNVGTELAKMPVDPRVGRMILAGRQFGCIREILILAAVMSLPDPREREFSTQMQGVFEKKDEHSDFLVFLRIWSWFQKLFDTTRSKSAIRRACEKHHLSFLRLFEWRDLHSQLSQVVRDMGFKVGEAPSGAASIHQALLTGLLGNIGYQQEEKGAFRGPRDIKFQIHPGSSLHKNPGKWVVSFELVETTKLYARTVARIDRDWIEPLASHLTRSTFSNPRWSRERGNVIAKEQVTLYGLIIVPARSVIYGKLNPQEARQIFIQSALVRGDVRHCPPFMKHNLELMQILENMESRSRRQDILVDESIIYSFFDERVPQHLWNWSDFERWRSEVEKKEPKLLFLTKSFLSKRELSDETFDLYPEWIDFQGKRFQLTYRFEPGHSDDGVTLRIPIESLNLVDELRCEWLVPGLIRDKIAEIIKSLPKAVRRNLFPISAVVDQLVTDVRLTHGSLYGHIHKMLRNNFSLEFPREEFSEDRLPAFLRMNFSVFDENKNEIDSGRDLKEIRRKLGQRAQAKFSQKATSSIQQKGLTTWSFGELPESVEVHLEGQTTRGFPCIRDDGNSVSICIVDTEIEASRVTRTGTRRLFQLALKEQFKYVSKNIENLTQMTLLYSRFLADHERVQNNQSVTEQLKNDFVMALCDRAMYAYPHEIRNEESFKQCVNNVKPKLIVFANELNSLLYNVLSKYVDVSTHIEDLIDDAVEESGDHIRAHLKSLMHLSFLSETSFEHLKNFPRYLDAINIRISKVRSNVSKDLEWQGQLNKLEATLGAKKSIMTSAAELNKIHDIKLSLEELRVSLWAQQLKTLYPVSFKRVERQISELI